LHSLLCYRAGNKKAQLTQGLHATAVRVEGPLYMVEI